ncbi:LysE family translocator [Oryzibacter oryziterrae]|uniref:LysE family translocator n=1 Tax=Oryzibacter oryziterrae TaxID=2766474 RepID=UPI001F490E22|nr:LysE family translocator [Oryzibacter oryziterrae]
MDAVNLPLILSAAFLATASPGPSTMTIAATSMAQGRARGLALAGGVLTGSLFWSITAALGLGAIMLANVWLMEALRYFGAGYLLFLACKSAKGAIAPRAVALVAAADLSPRQAYVKGVLLHLTNPKAILFFGALYSVGVPAGVSPKELATVILAVGLQCGLIFSSYALLFSSARVQRGFVRLRRWFDGLLALAFVYAGFKIVTAPLR